MAINRNPVYDDDYVTLGYLKEQIDESSKETRKAYSRNFGTQPTPPYYVNDTWTDDEGKLYVCIKERLIGKFDISDWTLIIDKKPYDDLVAEYGDITVDMLASQVYDHKLESFVQATDPSDEWETYIDREQHVYDFWRNTTDGKEYVYVRKDTNPITYEWELRAGSSIIWNTATGHKNMFNQKPETYDQYDLWYVDDSTSPEDIPDGININTWVMADKANTEYDKTDWSEAIIDIDLFITETKVYSKVEVDRRVNILENTFNTKLVKTENSIMGQVSSTYATQEVVTLLDSELGLMEDRMTTTEKNVNTLELTSDRTISSISSITNKVSGSATYDKTTDTVFTEGTDYYIIDEDHYVMLAPGVDYVVGSNIADYDGDVYNATFTGGLEDDLVSTNQKVSTLEQTSEGFEASIASLQSGLGTTNQKVTTLEATTDGITAQISNMNTKIDGVSADFEDFKDNEYIQSINNLQDQIDGAIQFWNGPEIPTINNYPANQWTTEADKNNHRADIYTVIEDIDGELKQGKGYRFDKVGNTWQWIELTDNELSAVQAIAQEALDKSNKNGEDITQLEKKDLEIEANINGLDVRLTTLRNDYDYELTTSQTVTGNPITIEDAGAYPCENFIVEGKSVQETRSGKNLLKNTNVNSGDNNYWWDYSTFDEATRTLTRSTTSTSESFIQHRLNGLKSNTQYTLSLYAKSNGYVRSMDFYCFNQATQGIKYKTFNITTEFQKYTFTFTTDANVDYSTDARIRIDNNGTTTSGTEATLTVKDVMLVEGTDTEYEDYGVSPSPDYPSEIKTVKGIENLFTLGKETKTGIGVNVDFNYSEININGTTSSAGNVFQKRDSIDKDGYRLIGNFKAGTYTFNSIPKSGHFEIPSGGAFAIYLRKADGTEITVRQNSFKTTKTFTLTEDTTLYLQMYVNGAGSVFNNCVVEFQIEKGSVAHHIVPYGSRYLINKITGKNLFKPTLQVNGTNVVVANGTVTLNDDEFVFTAKGTDLYLGQVVSPGTAYNDTRGYLIDVSNISQISFWVSNPLFTKNLITKYDENKISLGYTSFTSTQGTYNIPSGVKYISFRFGYGSAVAGETYKVKVQITEGNSFTGYEPYKENIIIYDLQGNELVSINDIKDELDEATGVLTKRIGKVVLDGSENWQQSAYTNDFIYSVYCDFIPNINHKKPYISDNFKFLSLVSSSTNEEYISNSSLNTLRIGVFKSRLESSDLSGFKKWLSNNPVTVYYELAEPETIQLQPTEIELFKGTNNIYTLDDLEPNMNITYLTDSKMNAQYATKSELKIESGNIKSEINATLKNEYATIEQTNAIEQKITDSTNQIMLEVNKKVNDEDFTGANILLEINNDTSQATINADKINLNGVVTANKTFKINTDGSMEATGGKIGGWNITTNDIYNSASGISSNLSKYAFWAGETNNANGTTNTDAKFRVGHDGSIHAIAGEIGGWNISTNYIDYTFSNGDRVMLANGTNEWKDVLVCLTGGQATFYLHADGYLHASKGSIAGDIVSSGINAGNITAGTLNIHNGRSYYLKMGFSTNHPEVSGLNVTGSGGIDMNNHSIGACYNIGTQYISASGSDGIVKCNTKFQAENLYYKDDGGTYRDVVGLYRWFLNGKTDYIDVRDANGSTKLRLNFKNGLYIGYTKL